MEPRDKIYYKNFNIPDSQTKSDYILGYIDVDCNLSANFDVGSSYSTNATNNVVIFGHSKLLGFIKINKFNKNEPANLYLGNTCEIGPDAKFIGFDNIIHFDELNPIEISDSSAIWKDTILRVINRYYNK